MGSRFSRCPNYLLLCNTLHPHLMACLELVIQFDHESTIRIGLCENGCLLCAASTEVACQAFYAIQASSFPWHESCCWLSPGSSAGTLVGDLFVWLLGFPHSVASGFQVWASQEMGSGDFLKNQTDTVSFLLCSTLPAVTGWWGGDINPSSQWEIA